VSARPGVYTRPQTGGSGFTLVEVMVALAIVAIALPALLLALSRQSDDTAYLRDKTIAQMVAANKLAELRLVIASTRNLQAGRSNGVETMVQRDWHWWVETVATPVANFFRIEIRVALDPEQRDQPLYTLTAFMSSDLEVDTEGLPGAEDGDNGNGDDQTGEEGEQQGGDTTDGLEGEAGADQVQQQIDQQQDGAGTDE